MGREWMEQQLKKNGGYTPINGKFVNHDYAVGMLYCANIEREYQACLKGKISSSTLSKDEFYKIYDRQNNPNVFAKMSKEYKGAFDAYLSKTDVNCNVLSIIVSQYQHATQERYFQDGTTLHGRFQPQHSYRGKDTSDFRKRFGDIHQKNRQHLSTILDNLLVRPYAEYHPKKIAAIRKRIADLDSIYKTHEKALDYLKDLEKKDEVYSDVMPTPIKLDYLTLEGRYNAGGETVAVCPPEVVLEAEKKIAGTFQSVHEQITSPRPHWSSQPIPNPELAELKEMLSVMTAIAENKKIPASEAARAKVVMGAAVVKYKLPTPAAYVDAIKADLSKIKTITEPGKNFI
ncbi:hypothetical protein FACS189425_01370 [Clostridia bacterium]|nr:hypothetical protein FACS189425_01370 [Clostridia bacterium]